jgi:prevent-host-death family protein
MEMSVREARAQFAHALAAVERGERVTVTKHGKPIAEIGPPSPKKKGGIDWDHLEKVRREMGFDRKFAHLKLDEEWRKDFDDPAWTRELFGLDRDDEDDLLR